MVGQNIAHALPNLVTGLRANMAFPSALVLAYALCALLCICSLQSGVKAIKPATIKLTYYLLEIRGGLGTNGTIFPAAGTSAGNTSAMPEWGTYFVFDNPLREGPSLDSKPLGKSTGLATVTNKGGILQGGVQINCQHVYGNGSLYHNSSITVQGQVDFTGTPPWECLVPGGTGYFRGYRGYGIASLETDPLAALVVYKWRFYLSK